MRILIAGIVGAIVGALATIVVAGLGILSVAGSLDAEDVEQRKLAVRLQINKAQARRIAAAAEASEGEQIPLTKDGNLSIICPGENSGSCDLRLDLRKAMEDVF